MATIRRTAIRRRLTRGLGDTAVAALVPRGAGGVGREGTQKTNQNGRESEVRNARHRSIGTDAGESLSAARHARGCGME
jgi:hypothetical protein